MKKSFAFLILFLVIIGILFGTLYFKHKENNSFIYKKELKEINPFFDENIFTEIKNLNPTISDEEILERLKKVNNILKEKYSNEKIIEEIEKYIKLLEKLKEEGYEVMFNEYFFYDSSAC